MKGSARAKARRSAWVSTIGFDPMRTPEGQAPAVLPNQPKAPASKDRRAAWLASIGEGPNKTTADRRAEQVALQVAQADVALAEAEPVREPIAALTDSGLPVSAPESDAALAVAVETSAGDSDLDDDLPDSDDDLLGEIAGEAPASAPHVSEEIAPPAPEIKSEVSKKKKKR